MNGEPLPSDTDPTTPSAEGEGPPRLTLICPECGGVLSEHKQAGVSQWECRVGHRYSPETLADAQAEGVEAALWTAVRALSDRSRLLHRLADAAQSRGDRRTANAFTRRARQADEQAVLVRGVLVRAGATALRKVADEEGERIEEEGDVA